MSLTHLIAASGSWRGTNQLWLSPPDPPDESPSTLAVVPVLHGTFVRLDQTWSHDGRPQEGTLLLGCNAKAGTATAGWADTMHTGRAVMAFTGTVDPAGTVDVRGTYAVGAGPAWGWRIRISARGRDALTVEMFNASPDGVEEPAVRATYTPA